MRKRWIIQCVSAGIFALAVPVVCWLAGLGAGGTMPVGMPATSAVTQPATAATTGPSAVGVDQTVVLPVLTPQGIVDIDLGTYLTGVLLAELPTDFHDEAFRAQAVAARTFVLRLLQQPKHGQAAICTDAACCQGWTEPVEGAATRRAAQAVADTDGEVVPYQGQLIDATYFSCSGDRTEAAVAVWGSERPYLQSVDSPGEEMAVHDRDTVLMTTQELRVKLGEALPEADLTGTPLDWFENLHRTDGGGIATITVGGVEVTGTRLRQILGLQSTWVTITPTENGVLFVSRGYGHRVGLSQYGAQAMALAGSTYQEILTHYYVDTQITTYGN